MCVCMNGAFIEAKNIRKTHGNVDVKTGIVHVRYAIVNVCPSW